MIPWCDPCSVVPLYDRHGNVTTFRDYCATRADLHEWLSPLFGRRLICTCDKPIEQCHATHLIELCRMIAAQEEVDCDECDETTPHVEWDAEDDNPSFADARIDMFHDPDRVSKNHLGRSWRTPLTTLLPN